MMHSISVLTVLAIALSCTLAFDVTLNQQWKSWKETNNKRYSGAQELVRRAIWKSNLKIVEEHNRQADLGVYTYWLGMNKYADLTIDEFVKQMNGYNVTMRGPRSANTFGFNPSLTDLPDTVDWREKGCVSGVKDQGPCGSSLAFSIVGAMEGEFCNKPAPFVPLSVQQILDCSGIGCTGGTPEQVYEYLKKAGGLEGAATYPYDPTGKCHFDPTKIVAKFTNFVDIKSKDESALQQAVATVGPVAVAVDAAHSSFQLYAKGVYNEPSCSQTQLDLSVLNVGYGTDSGKDYWIVKNSWGTAWGDHGYILMTRNKNNQCGIATDASYPIA